MIRIEPEDPVKDSPSSTCGGTNRLMHGYIYEDEYAHGIYFLEWCDDEHSHEAAFLTIGLGAFGDGTDAAGRNSFCIEWRVEGMRLTDERAKDRPELMGTFLPREVAIDAANIDHSWHAADHVVTDDPRVASVEAWLKHDSLPRRRQPRRSPRCDGSESASHRAVLIERRNRLTSQPSLRWCV